MAPNTEQHLARGADDWYLVESKMIFWVILALMTGAAIFAVIWPLRAVAGLPLG